MSEAKNRVQIDSFLRSSGWVLPDMEGQENVEFAYPTSETIDDIKKQYELDYLLLDSKGFPLCVIEAKRDTKSPLEGKEQARKYAQLVDCRFVILSNGISHYFWDTEKGNPVSIEVFPTQEYLELRKTDFSESVEDDETIDLDYIILTQEPNYAKHPEYINESTRKDYLAKNKLRLLRDYQLKALNKVREAVKDNKDRFLLEMATGTGKTLTSSAIIKMFLRLFKVNRVLFLVDRIELERQAFTEFDDILKNDFRTVIWKDQQDWRKAEIVVSTVQSFVTNNKYKRLFKPNDFGLVISDEAHRSLGSKSKRVFEYFIGYKLGLTATPKDYLRSVNVDDLSVNDPRQLERRYMMDTYTTFGCENSEPTYRYSLKDGVKDGYLINPKVLDARTDITTELLSENGYLFKDKDEEGNDIEEVFSHKDFERKFFSSNTNRIFCETFIKRAKKDPYTNEIGKTLIFAVSQKHATKITQILNEIADQVFPNQYRSDFAVQVTSNIDNSQNMSTDFKNNKLNGFSKSDENYRTSKTRVCVTVGMMTTGYDCTDILNICLMRPIFSPSDFIQMKGRGTRKCDFKFQWIDQEKMPLNIVSDKNEFYLFDFFGNYEYFEEKFIYDEVIKLPAIPSSTISGDPQSPKVIEEAHTNIQDPLKFLEEITISVEGMKIDRELYKSFENIVYADAKLQSYVKEQDFINAEKYLNENILNKPNEYFTLDSLKKALGLDRDISSEELLKKAFGLIDRFKMKQEILDEEFEKFDDQEMPDQKLVADAKTFFDSYATDIETRTFVDAKEFAKLNTVATGDSFKRLPSDLREKIPLYIKQNKNLERLLNA